MNDAGFDPNRLGTALRQMAEDLATERRRVRLLQRQVTALEAQLAALGHTSMSPGPALADCGEADGHPRRLISHGA